MLGFPCGSAGKESTCNAGDLCSIPGLGTCPGEVKGYPLQYSGLENSTDCVVHRISKSWTWLSDFHFHLDPQIIESYCPIPLFPRYSSFPLTPQLIPFVPIIKLVFNKKDVEYGGFPCGSAVKTHLALTEEENATWSYPHLGNPMGRGVWLATVHWVAKVGHSLETECTCILNVTEGLNWEERTSPHYFYFSVIFLVIHLVVW